MSTLQQGEKGVGKVLSERRASRTSASGLLTTRAGRRTVGGRLGKEAAKLAKRSEKGHPDVPVRWHLCLHLIQKQPPKPSSLACRCHIPTLSISIEITTLRVAW